MMNEHNTGNDLPAGFWSIPEEDWMYILLQTGQYNSCSQFEAHCPCVCLGDYLSGKSSRFVGRSVNVHFWHSQTTEGTNQMTWSALLWYLPRRLPVILSGKSAGSVGRSVKQWKTALQCTYIFFFLKGVRGKNAWQLCSTVSLYLPQEITCLVSKVDLM